LRVRVEVPGDLAGQERSVIEALAVVTGDGPEHLAGRVDLDQPHGAVAVVSSPVVVLLAQKEAEDAGFVHAHDGELRRDAREPAVAGKSPELRGVHLAILPPRHVLRPQAPRSDLKAYLEREHCLTPRPPQQQRGATSTNFNAASPVTHRLLDLM
jgi:hypothetical protein